MSASDASHRFEGVYVHVPFCSPGKCRYCDFYSVPREEGLEALFLRALRREAERAGAGVAPRTVYVGGGTPTALSELSLLMLFEALSVFSRHALVEFTVEANPGTFGPAKAELMRNGGADRMSIGVQSFDDGVLRFLGRHHTAREAVEAVRVARRAGFENVSLDLISDVPGTGRGDWRRELEAAVALEPDHISVYSLTLEPGTPLHAAMERGEFAPFDPDESAARMEMTASFLELRGYGRYEVSNYALPGRECAHNRIYWRNGPVLGLGPSAVTFDGRTRTRNVADVEGYVRALERGERPAVFSETLAARRLAGETAMLMLRRREGIVRSEFLAVTGEDPFSLYAETIAELESQGLLERDGESARIPPSRMALADHVALHFIETGE